MHFFQNRKVVFISVYTVCRYFPQVKTKTGKVMTVILNFPIHLPPKKPAACCTLVKFFMLPWALPGGTPSCPSVTPWLLPLHPFCHPHSNALQKPPLPSPGGKTKWDQANRPEAAHSHISHMPVFLFPGSQRQGTQLTHSRTQILSVSSLSRLHITSARSHLCREGTDSQMDGKEEKKKHQEKQLCKFSAAERKKLPLAKFHKTSRFTDNSIKKVWLGTETQ